MDGETDGPLWGRFRHDPRVPASGTLRASDTDRDVVLQVLAEGYADGRLDREEYDARAESAMGARLLGDLPAIVADLVPAEGDSGAVAARPDTEAQATQAWRRRVRQAAVGMAGPSVMTTGIWGVSAAASGHAYFFWPAFVILGTGMNLVRTVASRSEIEDRERARIEKRKELPEGPDGEATR